MSKSYDSDDEDIPPVEVDFEVEIPANHCAGAAINWIKIRRVGTLDAETPVGSRALINHDIGKVQVTYNSTCSEMTKKAFAEYKINELDVPIVVVPIGLAMNGLNANYHSFGECAILEVTINSLRAGLYFVCAKGADTGHAFAISLGEKKFLGFNNGEQYSCQSKSDLARLLGGYAVNESKEGGFERFYLFTIDL